MSKLCYLIQLWRGADKYLIKTLQVLQNKTARTVMQQSWFTPTWPLLKQCNWLSVRQFVFYQMVLTSLKIVTSGTIPQQEDVHSLPHDRLHRGVSDSNKKHLITYDHLWSLMIIFNHLIKNIWSLMITYDHLWSFSIT
jgi:hypothetical protein